MNPIEAFLSEKIAAPSVPQLAANVGKPFGGALLQGLGAGVGATLLAGGAVAAQRIYDAATSKHDFRKMLEWNQDLRGEDQRLVTQSFRTLRSFAPDMSRDPLVSGTLVRRMVQAPEGVAGIVQQALGGQKDIASPLQEAYVSSMGRGLHEGMGAFSPRARGRSEGPKAP